MATALLKPIIEHLAMDLIHNVKILLNETIKAMAHTKQFKRFIEKLFLLTTNVSLDVTIKEMKSMVKPPPVAGSDAAKFKEFLDKVKQEKNASIAPSRAWLEGNPEMKTLLETKPDLNELVTKAPELLTSFKKNPEIAKKLADNPKAIKAINDNAKLFTIIEKNPDKIETLLSDANVSNNPELAISNFLVNNSKNKDPIISNQQIAAAGMSFMADSGEFGRMGSSALKAASKSKLITGIVANEAVKNAKHNIAQNMRGGATETIDTTKYVIEPRIFPHIPDITPDSIKKFFYTPIEPFLQVITCKNCNNGMFVRIKNKIICNLMKLITMMITLLIKTGMFNSTVIYGSFKKVLNELAKDPKNIEESGKLPRLINIFETQILKNEKRLEEIEEEEKSEFENLTGMEKHEKDIAKQMEERNKLIDEVSRTLEEAILEIKEDEYLPGPERKPDEVRAKVSDILKDVDEKGGKIKGIVSGNEIPPEYKQKIASANKNAELKKRANKLIRDLRALKSLPHYDETVDNPDKGMDPKPRIERITKELTEIKQTLGGP